MDTAILHRGNSEREISADEYYSLYGSRGDRSTWLTCPECGQPVVARAMKRDSIVSPYFKHEHDNPVAQECPNYRYGGGWSSGSGYASLGRPLPVLLCNLGEGLFDLSVEFPPIDEWALVLMESQGMTLKSGIVEYPINRGTFKTDDYVLLDYGVVGGSFGLGLQLVGAYPYELIVPDIEHVFNGCMLFEALDPDYLSERLSRPFAELSPGDECVLAYSTVKGLKTARAIQKASAEFEDLGSIENSEGLIRVVNVVFSDEAYDASGRLSADIVNLFP